MECALFDTARVIPKVTDTHVEKDGTRVEILNLKW